MKKALTKDAKNQIKTILKIQNILTSNKVDIVPQKRENFFNMLFPLMKSNMERMQEDINWLVEKFDYENADKDWKNSKDAVQRGMQKLKGGFPADPPYKMKK